MYANWKPRFREEMMMSCVAVKEKVTVHPALLFCIWTLGTRRSAAKLPERDVEGLVSETEAPSRKSLSTLMAVWRNWVSYNVVAACTPEMHSKKAGMERSFFMRSILAD